MRLCFILQTKVGCMAMNFLRWQYKRSTPYALELHSEAATNNVYVCVCVSVGVSVCLCVSVELIVFGLYFLIRTLSLCGPAVTEETL